MTSSLKFYTTIRSINGLVYFSLPTNKPNFKLIAFKVIEGGYINFPLEYLLPQKPLDPNRVNQINGSWR